MEELVKHFGYTIEELGELLHSTNAFIAGSSPLSVFLKEKYKNFDLDIFLRVPYNWSEEPYYPYENLAKDKIHLSLSIHGYELVKNKEGHLKTTEVEYMKCALRHFIKNISTYERKDTDVKVQIITVYDCTIEEFIETFDLNICRLVIIGQNYPEYNLKLMTEHLSDIDLENIRCKNMYVNNLLCDKNLIHRIHKYVQRGFHWINAEKNKPLEEFSKSFDDIREYVNTNLNKVLTYEQFCCIKKTSMKSPKKTD